MQAKAFQKLILQVTDQLFRFAYWRVGNRQDAEDLVQETWIRLWKSRKQLDLYEKPVGLAFKVLRNLCMDRQRKQRPNTLPILPNHLELSNSISQQRRMELKEDLALIQQKIQGLPELQQTIFFLRHMEEMEVKEIAVHLEIKVNTIHAHISRTRKFLRSINLNHGAE